MNTLIAIITSKATAAQAQLARRTWIPFAIAAGYDIKFFGAEESHGLDNYLSVIPKSVAAFQWACKYDYARLLRITDDTYVRVDRLRDFGWVYGGHIWPACDFGLARDGIIIPDAPAGSYPHNYVSGGAIWMARDAIRIMAVASPNGDWTDDRWTGDVLAKAGIKYKALPEFFLNHNCNEGFCTCIKDKPGEYVIYLDAGDRVPALHQEMLNA